jgi:hypothetical protein
MDKNFSARQGGIYSAPHKVYFHYHTQYGQNMLLQWLYIYLSSCYRNAVQNKNVSACQGETTSVANKLVSFPNHIQILFKL